VFSRVFAVLVSLMLRADSPSALGWKRHVWSHLSRAGFSLAGVQMVS